MSTPTTHQRWDAKNNRSIGVPIDSARLIATACKCPLETTKNFISPSAPSTAGLRAPWQQTPTVIPGVCDNCERELYADEAHSSETGACFIAFSLSDACPDIGGAHGYVDLLKRVTIPDDDWIPFALALEAAGIDARRQLSVRDRILAYVLWNAAMAPPDHRGLGFAPGIREVGGTVRFLDMLDPLKGVVEVDFFDFLRVLLEKVELDEEYRRERDKRRRIKRLVEDEKRRVMRTLREKLGQEENEEYLDEDRRDSKESAQTSSSSTTTIVASNSSDTTFLPPFDPPFEREHWCLRAGLRTDNWYRVPLRRSLEAVVARECALAQGRPVPDDKVPEPNEKVCEPKDKAHEYIKKGKCQCKCRTDADPNNKGKGRADLLVDDWVFFDQPSVEWSAADEPPFSLGGEVYRVEAAAKKEKQKEGERGRRAWAERAGNKIVRVFLRQKEERKGPPSKVSAEWNRRKVALGRSFAGR